MRKICVITGTRAEYGLLYWLMKEIESDPELHLQLIVAGMHLSPEFGLTYKEIEKEFRIDKKIEMLLSSDTPIGISKSMGLAQISFAEAYEELKPDIIVVLGDRFEIFSAVASAMISNLPVAHLNGGELTEGVFDDPIRHCLTKMSHLHFTATEEYRQRVIQLGEHPGRVFNVGEAGLDNIFRLKLLSRKELEESIGFNLNKRNLLVTYHPVTLGHNSSEEQIEELLSALDVLNDTHIIFTKANADKDGRIINQRIEEYVAQNSHKSIVFASLGQLRFLSAMQYMDAIVGNSSSGIVEAPTLKCAAVNIGDRQRGRIQAEGVVNCAPKKEEIIKAVETIYSREFRKKLIHVKNPYGGGGSSATIKDIIKSFKLDKIVQKSFFDINISE